MKAFYILAAAAVMSGPLQARECVEGSAEILSVSNWSAEVVDLALGRGIGLSVSIQSQSDSDLRMVYGNMYFDDVLGRAITNLSIEDDARILAGGVFEQSGRYQSHGQADITRLATAEPSDIVITTCVVAAVTGNGEVLRFDE